MILYLHGFRSSPQSYKAQLMAQALRERRLQALWHCPQLPASPAQAIAQCHQLISQFAANPANDLCIIGSSLGGYYAAHLAQVYDCRAVLLNPAVYAARDLVTQVGSHKCYHSDQDFHFLPEYVHELAALALTRPSSPEKMYLLAAQGDEVLDWREMVDWCRDCPTTVIKGGDHGLSDFPRYLNSVLDFALLSS